MKPKLAIVLAGLGGLEGNGARLLEHASLEAFDASLCVLTQRPSFGDHAETLREANALLFITGTYWDSWSSYLQRFLEEATPTEATAMWLGKPLAVWVTAHSVGGKGVLSRLQGVLSTFGVMIPPMTGVVVTKANELAAAHAPEESDDFFTCRDLDISLHNLAQSLKPHPTYLAWDVERSDPMRRWVP